MLHMLECDNLFSHHQHAKPDLKIMHKIHILQIRLYFYIFSNSSPPLKKMNSHIRFIHYTYFLIVISITQSSYFSIATFIYGISKYSFSLYQIFPLIIHLLVFLPHHYMEPQPPSYNHWI